MKCQNCGKNEATFYYKSNINGRVMESHLCPPVRPSAGPGAGYAPPHDEQLLGR